MTETRKVFLPAQYSVDGKVLSDPVRQLRRAEIACECEVRKYSGGQDRWLITQEDGTKTLVVPRRLAVPADVDEVLLIRGGEVPVDGAVLRELDGKARWLEPASSSIEDPSEARDGRCSGARSSWRIEFR